MSDEDIDNTLRIARIRALDSKMMLNSLPSSIMVTREVSTLNELIDDLDAIRKFHGGK